MPQQSRETFKDNVCLKESIKFLPTPDLKLESASQPGICGPSGERFETFSANRLDRIFKNSQETV
jgi:hypothetical protein